MTDYPTLRRMPGPAAGTVAITIDDGPNAETTPALLDLLAAYDAKASFFAVGKNLKRHPALAERILAAGHGLFGHSWDHTEFDGLTARQITRQLERTEAQLRRFRPSTAPQMIRLPCGTGVDDERVRAAMDAWSPGLVAAHWTLSAREWTFITECRTPSQINKRVGAAVRRLAKDKPDWDGAIILLHDWPSHPIEDRPLLPLAPAFCATLLEQVLLTAKAKGLRAGALFP